jgi:toxin ParE1/3/4
VKPARLRPQAEDDLLSNTDWYLAEGGAALAVRFFDTAHEALSAVERMPGIGSLRLGQLAGYEDLRSWPADPVPARWFYFERDDHLDVVRLLGERQNVAAILRATRE